MTHDVVSVEWEGRPVEALVPGSLRDIGRLAAGTEREAARAEGVLTASAIQHDPRLEIAARLLLRAEGVASSRIEAIDAPAELVAVADQDPSVGGPAAWVADNLRAVEAALAHEGSLRAADIWGWHRVLMASSDLEEHHVGAWRDRLGWVGGPTPHRAAHVAAPHDQIDALMEDLLAYANRPQHDPVTAAGLVHAQFETIHPFADGNGRLGRLLIGWVLRHHLGLVVPPPVSVAFLRDVGGYLSGLALYRIGRTDDWIRWFAHTLEHAAMSATATLRAAADLAASWPPRLEGIRSDAAVHRLVDHLLTHPSLDVAGAAELLGVSAPTARTALEQLADRGIVRQAELPSTGSPGRPRRWWVAGELLDLLAR